MLKKRTLKNSIKAVGIGLHTGKNINMELIPAEANSGINFIRTDIDKSLVIPAIAENVGDTSLSTALVKDGVKISTIEHLLSACLLYTSPSPRDATLSRMPSSA